MNVRMAKLIDCGQSPWLDDLSRQMLRDGELARRIKLQGVRGVTSNPTTFCEAVVGASVYDEQIERLASEGAPAESVYEALAVSDVEQACDLLRPCYEESGGADGLVSLEVSPHLAYDADATVRAARRLWRAVDRPNVMIKVPGTKAGLPAIEQLLFEGINVNVTLLFSVARYEAVARAHMRALERRVDRGLPLHDVASVASFFISRIDALVDGLLEQRATVKKLTADATRVGEPLQLVGRAGVASAKLAYARFAELQRSGRWQRLAAAGARPQRLLWASTSPKNPSYRDVLYIENLVGQSTVVTMPRETIDAASDHAAVLANMVSESLAAASEHVERLADLDIQLGEVAARLEAEGVDKFVEPYDRLLEVLRQQCARSRMRADARFRLEQLGKMANKLRRDVIAMTTHAGSGHPSSCLSCAEIVATLLFDTMRWDPGDPDADDVDRFVLSKGHAAPILWAALSEAGAIDESLLSLRELDSTLEGHPTPRNRWIDVATGSLGQGLAAANGMALANRLDGIAGRVFCLLGDGECSEGSVWEAAQFAALERLDGVTCIVDANGLGQTGEVPTSRNPSALAARFAAFGWSARVIDGHDVYEVRHALSRRADGEPVAIIARTVKGKGVELIEGQQGWHGKALDERQAKSALRELPDVDDLALPVASRRAAREVPPTAASSAAIEPIGERYRESRQWATRDGFGHALKSLGSRYGDLVVLDGDVKNSTRSRHFAEAFPQRFVQSYIAEQNAVGVALGLAARGKRPCMATFAAFLSRAYDFLRMASHSVPEHLVLCGSHAGVSVGEDGPSQMGLEDLAMFRALRGSTIFYPADAIAAERLTALAMRTRGLVYLRTTRPKTPLLYGLDESFELAGSKVLARSQRDRVTIVAAGITVHEAMAARSALAKEGIETRVIDAYCVKPIDGETLETAARETGAVVVVEDHLRDGGLGDAVRQVLPRGTPMRHLAVERSPRSASKQQLLERHGLSREAIATAARALAA